MIKKLLKFLNHERYQVIFGLIALTFFVIVVSCRSKTQSILDPTKQVTRSEFVAELEYINKIAESRLDELDLNAQLFGLILEQALVVAQGGGINYNGLATIVFGIFGFGAIVDNVRKRREIKDLKDAGTNE